MTVALKSRVFETALDLTTFCADEDNDVGEIVSIVTDNSGKYVLFYTEGA